jgi:glutathione S-transferase
MITLWELGGKEGRRYSLFSWRTRMALAHKGLAYETQPVCMSDKAAIAFSNGKTVPVIKDGTSGKNDFVVRDSWKIAEYLEDQYPQAPSLFGGAIGRGVSQAFNTWVDRVAVPAMLPVIVADIHERVDPRDDGFFRDMMEKIVKKTLEQTRAERDDALKRLGRALEPMQAALKRQAYVCGGAPAYADYALFSVFQWARVMSPHEVLGPEDPLCAWRERMLDLHGGLARNVPTA